MWTRHYLYIRLPCRERATFSPPSTQNSHLLRSGRYICLCLRFTGASGEPQWPADLMSEPLRVLILEDRPDDALLVAEHLRRAGLTIAWERVDTEAEFAAKLRTGLDLIIADYTLPQFSAPRALAMLKAADLDIPFIVVSGNIGEDAAVASMRSGAHDYVFKGNLSRLRPAVEREVRAAVELKAARAAQGAVRRLAATGAGSTDAIISAELNGNIIAWDAGAEDR